MSYEDRMMSRPPPSRPSTTRRHVVLRFRMDSAELPVVRTSHDVPDDATDEQCESFRKQVMRDLLGTNPHTHIVECEVVSRW